jgi:hypothetical protein
VKEILVTSRIRSDSKFVGKRDQSNSIKSVLCYLTFGDFTATFSFILQIISLKRQSQTEVNKDPSSTSKGIPHRN